MGADERIDEFEKWSRGRGAVARDVDRKRIAGELFEIAGRGLVSSDHVEALVKRYRDGLVGANKVLLARRVAEEVLTWQQETPSNPPLGSSAPPPREPEPRAASTRPPAASTRPPAASTRPPAASASTKPPAASAISDELDFEGLFDERPPRRSSRPPAAKPARGASPPPRSSARPPPRPDPSELDGFDGAFEFDISSSKKDGLSGGEVIHHKRHVEREEDADDIGGSWLEQDEAGGKAPRSRDLSDPPARQTSEPPAPLKPAAPLLASEISLDDAPKRFQAGRSKPPSAPPKAGVPLADVENDGRGIDPERRRLHEDITDSIAPPPLAAAGPLGKYPLGDIVEEKRFSVSDYVSTKILVGAGGALFIVLLLATVILRPSFLFGDPHRPVNGRIEIENLGASLEFRDTWFHSEDLDDSEKQGPWTRHVSQFYRGGSDFQTASAKLTFIVFESAKQMASDEEARQIGTNETLNAAQRRNCNAFQFEGKKGTQCTALAGQFGRSYGVVETWYAEAGKTIFSRAMIEMPIMSMGVGGDAEQMAENQANFERELTAAFAEVEKVIFSLRLSPKK